MTITKMEEKERNDLIEEGQRLKAKMENARFIDPKDMRRQEEITSLLISDGHQKNLKFSTCKKGSRSGTMGLNISKPYYKKGKIG